MRGRTYEQVRQTALDILSYRINDYREAARVMAEEWLAEFEPLVVVNEQGQPRESIAEHLIDQPRRAARVPRLREEPVGMEAIGVLCPVCGASEGQPCRGALTSHSSREAVAECNRSRSNGGEEGNKMKPTVGRIVHYTSLGDRDGKYPPEIQAALITGVKLAVPHFSDGDEDSYVVDLHIFYRTGQFDMQNVPFTRSAAGSNDARGHWTWPEHV